MTLGEARAATAGELILSRTPGKWSKAWAAIFSPATVFSARVDQSFTSWDKLLEITYDGGVGSTSDVKADMMLLVGTSAGAHNKGITRVRSIDGTKIYIGETSDIQFADDDYLTIVNDIGLWARHVRVSSSVVYMDGATVYSDQHASPDPVVIAGGTRVLKLTGATVSTQYDLSASYVVGGLSSITGYSTSCPTADSVTGSTTSTPTVVLDTPGWHLVYFTLTAANGKSYTAVRKIFVWNTENPASKILISENGEDVDTGGWHFELTMIDNCDLNDVRDRAFIVVFTESHYGSTTQDIGAVEGCENVRFEGWIARESIDWNPAGGQVKFTAYNAQYWLSVIPAYPDGVQLVPRAAAKWTEFQALTVDKGLWHFLHWRTTATRVIDVFLTGDTKYTKEVYSLAENLWEQIREFAFLQIFARTGVNPNNQLFIQVHPQLVPYASRTWATVMTITKKDWVGNIEFDRIVTPPCAYVDLSGVAVNVNGEGVPYRSLSPGHTYPHYGKKEILDNLLAGSQAQSNSLAGLYRGWLNNPYSPIPIVFSADNNLIDCFPRQKCAIVISETDTVRGIAYNGNLIPVSKKYIQDPKTGYLHCEITFEAETLEDLSVIGELSGVSSSGTIPGADALKFPPLPDWTSLFPGDVSDAPNGPPTVAMVDDTQGLVFTNNFGEADGDDVIWQFNNAGIDEDDIDDITDFYIAPNGSVWVIVFPTTIYYAPALGAVFTKVIDADWLAEQYTNPNYTLYISGFGINPNKPEEVAFIAGGSNYYLWILEANIWIGDHNGFTQGASCADVNGYWGTLSFGGERWVMTGEQANYWGYWYNHLWRFSADASTLEYDASIATSSAVVPQHKRASTTEIFYIWGSDFEYSDDNGDTVTPMSPTGLYINLPVACDPTGQYLLGIWDTGKKGKSTDYAASWSALANLLPGPDYYLFAYAGGVGVDSRWIAARGHVWFSADVFGSETWVSKDGNLTTLITSPAINKIIVPGYF